MGAVLGINAVLLAACGVLLALRHVRERFATGAAHGMESACAS
jgi:hypothetical protein